MIEQMPKSGAIWDLLPLMRVQFLYELLRHYPALLIIRLGQKTIWRKKMKKLSFLFLVVFFVSPLSLHAQNLKNQVPSPKTKLEEFSARTGTVIIRGFEEIGSVYGLYNTSIKVEAKEFVGVSTGKKEYGITIEVKKEDGRYDKENTSYIDYDEIESLIRGIDYIAKVDKSSTKLSNFQADYNTKGDFKISTFSTAQKIMVAVSSGHIGQVSAYYNLSSLTEIKTLIEKWGGRVDDTISIDTNFLVLGQQPQVLQRPTLDELDVDPRAMEIYNASLQRLNRYNGLRDQAQTLWIPVFTYERFLYFIGYKGHIGQAGAF